MISRILSIGLIGVCCQSQVMSTEQDLRQATQKMYSAEYVEASAVLARARSSRPSDPRPVVLAALADLWRLLYVGISPETVGSLNANADAAVRLADEGLKSQRSSMSELYFWRGAARSIRIAGVLAPRALSAEKREFDIQRLLTGISLITEARLAEEDLSRVSSTDGNFSDARVLLVLFQQCRAADKSPCIAELWKSATDPRWFGIEIKYILLNLSYSQKTASEMRLHGIPLAIELHSRYPSNGLFHLLLAKMSYEIGDREASRTMSQEIIQSRNAQRFGLEAHYLLGLAAGWDSDWKAARVEFEQIAHAAPTSPAYLLPWSLLRLAQCEEAQGEGGAALKDAQRALQLGRQDAGLNSAVQSLTRRQTGTNGR